MSAISHALSSRLSSKTAYAMRRTLPACPSIYSIGDPVGYHASYMWLLARHGTRWPTVKKMASINNLSSLFTRSDLPKDHWVKDWVSPMLNMENMAGRLHPIGTTEMRSLGQRLRARFPSLLAQSYDCNQSSSIPLISTALSRTSESAEAFAQGFIPDKPVSIFKAPKYNDPLLRPFDLGSDHNGYMKHAKDVKKQLKAWKSTFLSQMTRKIDSSLRLGERSSTEEDVDALWQLLLTEGGLLHDFKIGSLFDPRVIDILEYMDDVDLYARRGPGYKINLEIFEPLLQDLIQSLRSAGRTVGGWTPRSRLLFAHCETLIPFLTLLDPMIFNTGHTQATQCFDSSLDFSAAVPFAEDRAWRSSAISPYGSNLAIILYQSSAANNKSQIVRLAYNEQIITLSNIDSLDGFLNYLQSKAKSSQV